MLGNEDVNCSLISAVREGRLERAKELINSFGLCYSQAWSEGYVLLCDALKYKHAAVAKLLLTSGAKVNSNNNKPSDTPLHFAVTNGEIEIVKMILDKGADINAKNQYDRTPLHNAIKNKKMEVTELLLKHSADVNATDHNSTSLLNVAAEIGCLQIVEHLLKYGADVNCVCTGYAPLHFAVRKGSKEVVTLLLSRGANVDVKGKDGITPLHIAAKRGYTHIAEDLLNHGACTHSFTLKEGYTPLHFASGLGTEEDVKLFLNKGADINASANGNLTPLHVATKKGRKIVVKLLLQHGAKVDNQDKDGKTTLRLAVEKGYLTIVEDVLRYRPDINDQSNRSSLKIAVLGYGEECKKIVEALLEYGLMVNPEDANNPELLHVAVEKGYVKVVEALLKYNANVNSVVKSDITPLHLSAQRGNEEITKMLLNKGANVNAKQKGGITALHIATKEGHEEVVKVLLEFGADVDSRDEYGETALHIASQGGHVEVVDTLLRYGSDINITSRNNHTPLDHAGGRISSFYSELNKYSSDEDGYCDASRGVRSCEVIAEALERHIVKMKIANLYVSEQNLLSVSSGGEISVFQDECEEEIASMKSEKINNSNISFYDILAKGTSLLAIYLRNENIVQALKSDDYKTKFPIYASMIESRFRKGMERKELLERGNKIFHFLFNNFPELPYDCTEKIFSYLSNKDLRILMDVCKPLSIGNPNTNINDVAITSSAEQATFNVK